MALHAGAPGLGRSPPRLGGSKAGKVPPLPGRRKGTESMVRSGSNKERKLFLFLKSLGLYCRRSLIKILMSI